MHRKRLMMRVAGGTPATIAGSLTRIGICDLILRDTFCGTTKLILTMPNDFWTKTNDAAKQAVREAKVATETILRRDWRLKKGSRGGSQSRVTLGEIRRLGRAASPQV